MTNSVLLPSVSNSTAASNAHDRATVANATAAKALKVRTREQHERSVIALMDNAVPTMLLLFMVLTFFAAAFGEYNLSYPFYQNFMEEMPVVLFFIIVAVGLLISEGLKFYLPSFRMLYVRKAMLDRPDLLHSEVEASAGRYFFWSKLCGTVALLVFCAFLTKMSYDRAMLLDEASLDEAVGFTLVDMLVVVAFIVEVFSGIYLLHAFERLRRGMNVWRLERRFEQLRHLCSSLTSAAYRYYQASEKESGSNATYSADVMVIVNRYEEKSISDDNYLVNDLAQPTNDVLNVVSSPSPQPKVSQNSGFFSSNSTASYGKDEERRKIGYFLH